MRELTKEEALGLLGGGEDVHCFSNQIVGTTWSRGRALAAINKAQSLFEAPLGTFAAGLNHRLVVVRDEERTYFLESKCED